MSILSTGPLQAARNILVRLGPDNPLTRAAVTWHGRRRGFRTTFGNAISIRKETCEMRIARSALQLVPYMLEYFDLYFRSFEPRQEGNLAVLDFSEPACHRYSKTGRE